MMNHEELLLLFNSANVLWRTGHYDEALEKANIVLEASRQIGSAKYELKALQTIGIVNGIRSDYHTSLKYLKDALAVAERINHRESIGALLGNLGLATHISGDYDTALAYMRRSLEMMRQDNNRNQIATQLLNIALLLSEMNDLGAALIHFHEGIEIALAENLSGLLGQGYSNLATLYQRTGDYHGALGYLNEALAIVTKIDDKKMIAQCYHNIATIYYELHQVDFVLEYFTKSIDICNEIGDEAGAAETMLNIGIIHLDVAHDTGKEEHLFLGLEFCHKALELLEKYNLPVLRARAQRALGTLLKEIKKYDESEVYFRLALTTFRALKLSVDESIALHNLARLYLETEWSGYDDQKAEKLALEALRLAETVQYPETSIKALDLLMAIHKSRGSWQKAFEYYDQFYLLERSVKSDAAKRTALQTEQKRTLAEAEKAREVQTARYQEQEKILHNVLPRAIADRMIAGERTIADTFDDVSIFFSDIVGFTKLSQRIGAEELVELLNGIFSQFDRVARKYGLEKIKTIGDSYMAVAGAPIRLENHAVLAALFALEVAELMKDYQSADGEAINTRIGLHTGSAVAGIIGENKFAYDLWGDAVNTASRMESYSEGGKIHVSEEFMRSTLESIGRDPSVRKMHFIERGEMEIKGKGLMKTYFLEYSL